MVRKKESEVRGQRSEVSDQKSVVGHQMSDVGHARKKRRWIDLGGLLEVILGMGLVEVAAHNSNLQSR